MISTQLESTHARELFPCLDDPSLKATFAMSIWRKAPYISLFNMPLEETRTEWVIWSFLAGRYFCVNTNTATYVLLDLFVIDCISVQIVYIYIIIFLPKSIGSEWIFLPKVLFPNDDRILTYDVPRFHDYSTNGFPWECTQSRTV